VFFALHRIRIRQKKARMSMEANRWAISGLCLLAAVLCPVGMTLVAMRCDSGRDPNPADIDLPSLAVDGLLLCNVLLSVGFVWSMPRWRDIGVLVAVPVVIAAAISWIFNGLWIEGQYF
jgi:hypothetical protein